MAKKPLSRETLLARGRCCGHECFNCPYEARIWFEFKNGRKFYLNKREAEAVLEQIEEWLEEVSAYND